MIHNYIRRPPLAALMLIALLLASLALSPAPVQAATFTVTSGNDSGTGSLRQAIASANANPDADTIVFSGVSTVTLTSGQLEITEDLTIDGGDGVTIERSSTSGTPEFRIFAISGTVTLDGLTIRNGNAGGTSFPDSGGGGIRNFGTLAVTNSTLSGNEATDDGGGIFNGGTLNVTNSTLSGNAADNNGGGTFNLAHEQQSNKNERYGNISQS